MSPDRHFIAINAALLAGYNATAAAMLQEYRREHTFTEGGFVSPGVPYIVGETGPRDYFLPEASLRRSEFPTVTGRDFGRSIAWAKAQPPGPLSNEGIRRHVSEAKQTNFAQGGCLESDNTNHVLVGVVQSPMPARPARPLLK